MRHSRSAKNRIGALWEAGQGVAVRPVQAPPTVAPPLFRRASAEAALSWRPLQWADRRLPYEWTEWGTPVRASPSSAASPTAFSGGRHAARSSAWALGVFRTVHAGITLPSSVVHQRSIPGVADASRREWAWHALHALWPDGPAPRSGVCWDWTVESLASFEPSPSATGEGAASGRRLVAMAARVDDVQGRVAAVEAALGMPVRVAEADSTAVARAWAWLQCQGLVPAPVGTLAADVLVFQVGDRLRALLVGSGHVLMERDVEPPGTSQDARWGRSGLHHLMLHTLQVIQVAAHPLRPTRLVWVGVPWPVQAWAALELLAPIPLLQIPVPVPEPATAPADLAWRLGAALGACLRVNGDLA